MCQATIFRPAGAGLFSTRILVDPATGVTGSIFSQTLPFGDRFQLCVDFEQALYSSLQQPRALVEHTS